LEVTDYQVRIIQRLFFKYSKQIVCTATTRAGKSLGGAIGIILASVHRPEKVRVVAPTQDHTKIIMGYVIQHIIDSELLQNALLFDVTGMGIERLRKEITKKKLTFKNGSEIMCISANLSTSGRSLVGWGGTLIFVDEGEQIPAEIMRTKIMRMLGDSPDSSIFIIGNPVVYGYMWEKSTDPKWYFMRIDWRQCVEAGRMTEEFVMDRKAEMNDNEFRIWYEALWPEEMEDQLFSEKALRNIVAPLTDEEIELLKTPPDRKKLGVDVARFGKDYSVVYLVHQYGLKKFLMESRFLSKKDTMKTVGLVVDWDRTEQVDLIGIDDIGVGGGVSDRLGEIDCLSEKVSHFIAGASPTKRKELYTNLKAQSFREYERQATKKLIRLVDPKNGYRLMEELRKMKFERTSSGKMKVIDPEDKSPDWADSSNIALWEGEVFSFAFA